MKKFVVLLLTASLLILLISFSVIPVCAAEAVQAEEASVPQTADYTELIVSVMLLSAAGCILLVGYKLEQKILF